MDSKIVAGVGFTVLAWVFLSPFTAAALAVMAVAAYWKDKQDARQNS